MVLDKPTPEVKAKHPDAMDVDDEDMHRGRKLLPHQVRANYSKNGTKGKVQKPPGTVARGMAKFRNPGTSAQLEAELAVARLHQHGPSATELDFSNVEGNIEAAGPLYNRFVKSIHPNPSVNGY